MKKDPKYFTDDDRRLILRWEETGFLQGLSNKKKLFLARHLEDAFAAIVYLKYEKKEWTNILCPIIRRVITKIEKDSVFCKKYPNYNIEILSIIKELNLLYKDNWNYIQILIATSYNTIEAEAEIVSRFSIDITKKIKKMIRNNKKEYFKKLLIEKHDK